jgi:membrane protein required for colicin V production
MDWLDILILIVLVISAISGLVGGFIKTVFSLVGLIVGVVVAGKLYVALAGHLGFFSSENVARIVAFVIILAIVMVAAMLLGMLFTKLASVILLGWLNRLLGAAAGVLMGGIAIGAILAVWVHYMGSSDTFANSALASFLIDKFPLVLGLLPSEFKNIRNFFE